MKILGAIFFAAALLFAGCASYSSRVNPGRSLDHYQRYFVKSNFDDNHAVDVRIMHGLQERGLIAESGPLTLMPDKTQAVISFEERWAWDFHSHLSALNIVVRDAKTSAIVASASYVGPAALTTNIDEAIDRLLSKLFHGTKIVKAGAA